ncbi:unnamed protein product [Lymnaea stagnalis]|uniref:Peptidase S1 domain-containing protein n=1 Tax=Lymnaea stagnalis TaxID=6523 RepID=A0AAV2GZ31_LYMST
MNQDRPDLSPLRVRTSSCMLISKNKHWPLHKKTVTGDVMFLRPMIAVFAVCLMTGLNNIRNVMGQDAVDGTSCLRRCQEAYTYYAAFINTQEFKDNYFNQCNQRCTTPDTSSLGSVTEEETTSSARAGIACGPNKSRVRIVGGRQAYECEVPWIVAVTVGTLFCGGTIVDSRHIVTAAHCLKNKDTGIIYMASSVQVRVGSSRIGAQRVYRVGQVFVHSRHVPGINDYDVAVLRLTQDLVFSDCVTPLCLPETWMNPFSADYCTAAGWGVTDFTSSRLQQNLRIVELPLVDMALCRNSYGPRYVNDLKLCAGDYINGGIDSCQGDSGGPLMCLYNGRFVLHGIVSFGSGCARARYPGIYTKVTNTYISSFIRSIIGS